jgi:hypothetical protein
MIALVLLWLAVAALAVLAWTLRGRIERLDQALREHRSDTYAQDFDLRESIAALEGEIGKLRMEMRLRAGALRVTPATTIGDALAMHPLVAPLLESFAVSGCSIHEVSSQQTLGETAAGYKVDPDVMVKKIQELLDDPDHFQMPPRGEVKIVDASQLIQLK